MEPSTDTTYAPRPRMVRLILAGIAALTLLGMPGPAAAAPDRVVAVLYFDNNTNDADFDVFQKGFADMLITDLAGVQGIKVVERARLQELLDEIALQKTSYFDPKTAVQLGKGLGAAYAITGSIAGYKPRLRIDARLVHVASGEVLVTTKVAGRESEIFELEQELVKRMLARMDERFPTTKRPRTKVPDVDTLLAYSRGLDLADEGNYEDAAARMKQVVSAAPSFVLARAAQQRYAKELAQARKRRTEVRRDLSGELAGRIDGFLEKQALDKLDLAGQQRYLAYRYLRGGFILRALDKHLQGDKGQRIVRPGRERQARELMRAYHANTLLLVREMDELARRHGNVPSPDLPGDEDDELRRLDIDHSFGRDPARVLIGLGEFTLEGRFRTLEGEYRHVAPPLSELDRAYKKLGYAHLRDAFSRADAAPRDEHTAAAALEAHADQLVLRDMRDQGVAKLQEILDRYPTHRRYDFYEKRIQQLLGMKHEHTVAMIESYAQGLDTCDDMSLRKGLGTMFSRRVRLHAVAGLHQVVAEVEKACQGNDKVRRFWDYLYSHAATAAGRLQDCKAFDHYMARYLEVGGSPRDAAGYRKNYSDCPAP